MDGENDGASLQAQGAGQQAAQGDQAAQQQQAPQQQAPLTAEPRSTGAGGGEETEHKRWREIAGLDEK